MISKCYYSRFGPLLFFFSGARRLALSESCLGSSVHHAFLAREALLAATVGILMPSMDNDNCNQNNNYFDEEEKQRCHDDYDAIESISSQPTTITTTTTTQSEAATTSTRSNGEEEIMHLQSILKKAEKHAQADQILAAARQLRQVVDAANNNNNNGLFLLLDQTHYEILKVAERVENTLLELSSVPDPTIWTKLRQASEKVHNNDDNNNNIIVYYKLDEHRRLTSRIEFLIDKSMLVPLLSVLVETELYNTWVPHWKFPPVGVAQVRKLAQTGRTHQILQADLDIPWRRDVIIASVGVEDVEANGILALFLGTYPEGAEIKDANGGESTLVRIPSPEHGVVRIDFEGCFVFRKCPPDHPLVVAVEQHSKQLLRHNTSQDHHHTTTTSSNSNSNPHYYSDDLILVSFTMFADAKISSLFPQWIVNFIIRVAIVRIFAIFMHVAEDVQAGRRSDHSAAIARKGDDIYDWIRERVNTMLQNNSTETLLEK